VNKARIQGSTEQAKGKVNEVVGKVTDDSKLESEGKADQLEGQVIPHRRTGSELGATVRLDVSA
jgi:uncharacterized protein YjbJ (UPF0337 family)